MAAKLFSVLPRSSLLTLFCLFWTIRIDVWAPLLLVLVPTLGDVIVDVATVFVAVVSTLMSLQVANWWFSEMNTASDSKS